MSELVQRVEAEVARSFSGSEAEAWRRVTEQGLPRLIEIVNRSASGGLRSLLKRSSAAGGATERASEAYLRFSAEAIRCGHLFADGSRKPGWLGALVFDQLPARAAELPLGDVEAALAQLWNLAEGVRAIPWLDLFLAAEADRVRFEDLETSLAAVLDSALASPDPGLRAVDSSWREGILDLRAHADTLVPGRLACVAGRAVAVEDRLEGDPVVIVFAMGRAPVVIGPVPGPIEPAPGSPPMLADGTFPVRVDRTFAVESYARFVTASYALVTAVDSQRVWWSCRP